jgi:hypothetical protein
MNYIFLILFSCVGINFLTDNLADPTHKNKTTKASSHFIGEEFGGGVIFHLWKDDQDNEHGLIVDKTDLDTAYLWSNKKSNLIGTSAQSTKDGLGNSKAIIAQSGHKKSAADLCLNSKNGGFENWYLPAEDELIILYENHKKVNQTLSEMKDATILQKTAYYWSSTEDDGKNAILIYFIHGDTGPELKYDPNFVRAIRAF